MTSATKAAEGVRLLLQAHDLPRTPPDVIDALVSTVGRLWKKRSAPQSALNSREREQALACVDALIRHQATPPRRAETTFDKRMKLVRLLDSTHAMVKIAAATGFNAANILQQLQYDPAPVAQLEHAVQTTEAATPSDVREALSREARALGEYVAAGRLTAAEVEAALFEAAIVAGSSDPTGDRATISDGIAAGSDAPRKDGLVSEYPVHDLVALRDALASMKAGVGAARPAPPYAALIRGGIMAWQANGRTERYTLYEEELVGPLPNFLRALIDLAGLRQPPDEALRWHLRLMKKV